MKTDIAKIIEAELANDRFPQESNEDFIQRVCFLYMTTLQNNKTFSKPEFLQDIAEEVEQEVVELFRMKTYGYYNLKHYRTAKGIRKSG